MHWRLFLIATIAALISGCAADYLNHYDSVTLASGDANRSNSLLQTVDPFNPNSQNTHIESDGARVVAVVNGAKGGGAAPYNGNCPTDQSTASDGSRCGGRSADSRPGGATP